MYMNSERKSSGSSGIGFSGLLTVAFIVLKLCGVINWPWIWVISPIWISLLIAIAAVIILFIVQRIINR